MRAQYRALDQHTQACTLAALLMHKLDSARVVYRTNARPTKSLEVHQQIKQSRNNSYRHCSAQPLELEGHCLP